MSPLFYLDGLVNFADDNFCIESNQNLAPLIIDMEKILESITKWLRGSGLIVNESKTEICLFHRNDVPSIIVTVNGVPIRSKKSMNVLGVIFDSKLNWSVQVANSISKAKKSLFAIKLLKKYFTTNELRTILDSYFYSVLYYNANIWLTPNLTSALKQNFQIMRNNRRKIGLNTTANKFYSLNNLIALDRLNLNFEHYKK